MAPHLEVKVGPDRFHLEPCRLNDTTRPHDIETEHFVGRVLIRILDAAGAQPGDPGRQYFDGRSRKFAIQIEGRFKQPYRGSDIIFGTDFDQWIDFPRAPFNAGMRVARMIDPSTYYDEHPPSGRPYIMSPYCACMNTICAWPAPYRARDAVVVLRHADTPAGSHTPATAASGSNAFTATATATTDSVIDGSDDPTDVVPLELLDRTPEALAKFREEQAAQKKKGLFGRMLTSAPKEARKSVKYWRFLGFKQDPRVRAFLEAHNAGRSIQHSHSSSKASTGPVRPATAPLTEQDESDITTPSSTLTPAPAPLVRPMSPACLAGERQHGLIAHEGAIDTTLIRALGTTRTGGGSTPPPPVGYHADLVHPDLLPRAVTPGGTQHPLAKRQQIASPRVPKVDEDSSSSSSDDDFHSLPSDDEQSIVTQSIPPGRPGAGEDGSLISWGVVPSLMEPVPSYPPSTASTALTAPVAEDRHEGSANEHTRSPLHSWTHLIHTAASAPQVGGQTRSKHKDTPGQPHVHHHHSFLPKLDIRVPHVHGLHHHHHHHHHDRQQRHEEPHLQNSSQDEVVPESELASPMTGKSEKEGKHRKHRSIRLPRVPTPRAALARLNLSEDSKRGGSDKTNPTSSDSELDTMPGTAQSPHMPAHETLLEEEEATALHQETPQADNHKEHTSKARRSLRLPRVHPPRVTLSRLSIGDDHKYSSVHELGTPSSGTEEDSTPASALKDNDSQHKSLFDNVSEEGTNSPRDSLDHGHGKDKEDKPKKRRSLRLPRVTTPRMNLGRLSMGDDNKRPNSDEIANLPSDMPFDEDASTPVSPQHHHHHHHMLSLPVLRSLSRSGKNSRHSSGASISTQFPSAPHGIDSPAPSHKASDSFVQEGSSLRESSSETPSLTTVGENTDPAVPSGAVKVGSEGAVSNGTTRRSAPSPTLVRPKPHAASQAPLSFGGDDLDDDDAEVAVLADKDRAQTNDTAIATGTVAANVLAPTAPALPDPTQSLTPHPSLSPAPITTDVGSSAPQLTVTQKPGQPPALSKTPSLVEDDTVSILEPAPQELVAEMQARSAGDGLAPTDFRTADTLAVAGALSKRNSDQTRVSTKHIEDSDALAAAAASLQLSGSADATPQAGSTGSSARPTPVPVPPGQKDTSVAAGSQSLARVSNRLSEPAEQVAKPYESSLDGALGPWRFAEPGTDVLEDNAFIKLHRSMSTSERRKYFSSAKARENFVFDPDVVYCTTFFTNMFDMNTFDLHIGPVRLNVHRWFTEMPLRYTLRHAVNEDITFATISFQIVDS